MNFTTFRTVFLLIITFFLVIDIKQEMMLNNNNVNIIKNEYKKLKLEITERKEVNSKLKNLFENIKKYSRKNNKTRYLWRKGKIYVKL